MLVLIVVAGSVSVIKVGGDMDSCCWVVAVSKVLGVGDQDRGGGGCDGRQS